MVRKEDLGRGLKFGEADKELLGVLLRGLQAAIGRALDLVQHRHNHRLLTRLALPKKVPLHYDIHVRGGGLRRGNEIE